MTIAEIIARMEKTTGPDRELDLAISVATNFSDVFHPAYDWRWGVGGDEIEGYFHGKRCAYLDPVQFVPRWTAMVDVALTLVPPHHLWELKQGIECRAIVWRLETDYDDDGAPTGYSTTYPALALSIAALKARQAAGGGEQRKAICGGPR